MEEIRDEYIKLCKTSSEMNEHLPTLLKYASECNSVLELSVRGCISCYALVYGLLKNKNNETKEFNMKDIREYNIKELINYCNSLPEKTSIYYFLMNEANINLNKKVDLTFINTWHVYGRLKRELEKFSKITNKYIIMHDTTLYAINGETMRNNWNAYNQSILTGIPIEEITKGMKPAIEEFLINHSEWKIKEIFINNNGLTILEKIQ
jgi:hypothetical protein